MTMIVFFKHKFDRGNANFPSLGLSEKDRADMAHIFNETS